MKKLLLLFTATLCLPFLSQVFAQSKIGYINVDEVFALMPETKKADSSLALYQRDLSDEYTKQETELNAAIDKFIKDSVTMSPAVKEAKRTDLQSRITGMSSKKQDFGAAFEKEKERQTQPIREKLLTAIKAVAKENGYGHILYKDQAIVFPETDDITPLVKKKLGIK